MSSSATATDLLAHTRPLRGASAAASGGGGGSYTAVFVVLGVIAVLLVISCLVGQVCTKKHLRPRPRRDRVAYYDDDMEGGGFGHGGPAIAKMEAAAPSVATMVETQPAAASVETQPPPALVETRPVV